MAIVRYSWRRPEGAGDVVGAGARVPRCDVYESENGGLVIEAELPGVRREDIEVEVNEGVLSVRGERQATGTGDERTYRRVERRAGAFERRFAIPDRLDAGAAVAAYNDGVLRITLPVKADARPRQIPVESAA